MFGLSAQDLGLLVPVVLAGGALVGYLIASSDSNPCDNNDRSDNNSSATSSSAAAPSKPAAQQGSGSAPKLAANAVDNVGEGDARSTETVFNLAADYIANFSNAGSRLPDPQLLELYALFKQGKEGKCTRKKPSMWELAARAKWDAWTSLEDMPKEEAMQKYIALVDGISPGWRASFEVEGGRTVPPGGGAGGGAGAGAGAAPPTKQRSGGVGPVQSTMAHAYGGDDDDQPHDIFYAIGSNDTNALADFLNKGGDVNFRNETGETLLHHAADSGNMWMLRLLLKSGADVNVTEPEFGGTPLGYAVTAGNEDAAIALAQAGADLSVKDIDGNLCTVDASEALMAKLTAAAKPSEK